MDRPAASFPPGFFERFDEQPDDEFYEPLRLVTHIDDDAIAAVGELYERLALTGDVLDLMSSWISHFRTAPASLTALGMNAAELARNPMATATVVHDLNVDPVLPFDAQSFDAVTCCVSVDYLVRPVEVFAEVARGPATRRAVRGRRSPTAASRPRRSRGGWPTTTWAGWRSCAPTSRRPGAFAAPTMAHCNPGAPGDPLYAAWAARA